ncbi:hypothetical protein ACF1BP_14905 [Streptomyces sp. NPDC014735]|uniref:hypothetical protein n=1 Tax=unclassified Streptomyces TaxID=2593676 RepID=UPI0036F4E49F
MAPGLGCTATGGTTTNQTYDGAGRLVDTGYVCGAFGRTAALPGSMSDTALQLTTAHGDVALRLPLDSTQVPVALDSDEYGNVRTSRTSTRYN